MGVKTLYNYFYKLEYGDKGADKATLVSDCLDVADAEIKANKDAKHTQGTDQGLDTGGANAVIVADVKDAVTKKHTQGTDYSNIVICADYDNPDDAITAIDTANKTLLVTEAETCDTNFTVPANVKVKFERGGKWTINTGITVTFNGSLQAGLWQIFAYTGTGTLAGTPRITAAYPEWWGAIPDDTTECATAIQNAVTLGIEKISFNKGTYKISSTITGVEGTLSGSNDGKSILKFYACNGLETAEGANFVVLEDLYITLSAYSKDQTGLRLIGTDGSHVAYNSIRHCFFRGWDECVLGLFCWNSVFDDILTMDCNIGIELFGQSVNNSISNCHLIASSKCIYIVRQETPEYRPEGTMISNSLLYGQGYGIQFYFASYNTVMGCTIDGTFTRGIINTGGLDNRIIGNWIVSSGNTTYGIEIADLGVAVDTVHKIIGNQIKGLDTADRGIRIGANSNRNVINSNTISGFDNYDIYIETTSHYNTINGNNLISNVVSIFIGGDYNTITGNTMDSFQLYNGADYNAIIGNVITDYASVVLGTTTGSEIKDNVGYVTETGTGAYKEGEWTATMVCGTSGTITLTENTGGYTKVGRMVTITGYFTVASVNAPVGTLTLNTLPFTCGNAFKYMSAISIHATGLEATAITQIMGFVNKNTASIILRHFAAGEAGAMAADVKAGSAFVISATYFTD